jgi:hypothetical protein
MLCNNCQYNPKISKIIQEMDDITKEIKIIEQ